MKLSEILLIMKLTLSLTIVKCEKNVDINLITDFITTEINQNDFINTFLCWEKNELVELYRELFQQNKIIKNYNFYPIHLNNRENNLFILDHSCNNSTEILLWADENVLFCSPNKWLMLIQNQSDAEQEFNALNILIDSKFVIAQRENNDYHLKYLYKIRRYSKIILNDFAHWNVKDGFLKYNNTILSWARRNINKEIIKVGSVIFNKHLEDNRDNNNDIMTEVNINNIYATLHYLNATQESVYYPYLNSPTNGTKDNSLLVGAKSGEFDLVGTSVFCMIERSDYLSCIKATIKSESFFIFRAPPLSYVKNIFILPFELDLWLTNIGFILVSAGLLYLIVSWEWKLIEADEEILEADMIHKTFTDALLFAIGGVTQQGYATEPKGGPGKILILTIFISLIFLFTAYTAYTMVLFQETSEDIKTPEDLYNSKMELGMLDASYLKYQFEAQTLPIRVKIYQDRIKPNSDKPHYYTIAEGLEKTRNEFFGFFIGAVSGYIQIQRTFLENEKCGLQKINFLDINDLWITAPKNSSFLEQFKVVYSKLQEYGLMKRESIRTFPQKPECTGQGSNFRSAGLLDLYALYMIFFIGVGGSTILLILEIILSKYKLYI